MYCIIWIHITNKKLVLDSCLLQCVMTRMDSILSPWKSQTKQLENLNRAVE